MVEVRVIDHQSLFDIAIQTTGHVKHVIDIALLNNLGITSEIVANDLVRTPILSKELKDYFEINNILVSTNNKNKTIIKGLPLQLPFI
jgi:hypothetical protein